MWPFISKNIRWHAVLLLPRIVLAGGFVSDTCIQGISGKLADIDVVIMDNQARFKMDLQKGSARRVKTGTPEIAMGEIMREYNISEITLGSGLVGVISKGSHETIAIPEIIATEALVLAQPSGIAAIDSSPVLTLLNRDSLEGLADLVSNLASQTNGNTESAPEITPTPTFFQEQDGYWRTYDAIPTPTPELVFAEDEEVAADDSDVRIIFAEEELIIKPSPSCTRQGSHSASHVFVYQPVVAATNGGQDTGSTVSSSSEQVTGTTASGSSASAGQPSGSPPPRKKIRISAVGPLGKKQKFPSREKEQSSSTVSEAKKESHPGASSPYNPLSSAPEGMQNFFASLIAPPRQEPRRKTEARIKRDKERMEAYARKKKKGRWEDRQRKYDEQAAAQPSAESQESPPKKADTPDTRNQQPQTTNKIPIFMLPRVLKVPAPAKKPQKKKGKTDNS